MKQRLDHKELLLMIAESFLDISTEDAIRLFNVLYPNAPVTLRNGIVTIDWPEPEKR